MSFQLPLELMLLANLALSLNLCLPLPLSKPGVAIVRFSTTPVGQGMTAAAFSILLLLLIQPLYDMNSLNKQKEVAAETITHKDGRCVADGRVIVQNSCRLLSVSKTLSKFGCSSIRAWLYYHHHGISL